MQVSLGTPEPRAGLGALASGLQTDAKSSWAHVAVGDWAPATLQPRPEAGLVAWLHVSTARNPEGAQPLGSGPQEDMVAMPSCHSVRVGMVTSGAGPCRAPPGRYQRWPFCSPGSSDRPLAEGSVVRMIVDFLTFLHLKGM